MTDKPEFDEKTIEDMNEKSIQAQFFTPDNIYIELGLLKDLPIGAIYAEQIAIKGDEDGFNRIQKQLLDILPDYQCRLYDTVEPFFLPLGYDDTKIDDIMTHPGVQDAIFMMAPATYFFDTLVQHTVRNQNHSLPADKYTKRYIDKDRFHREAIDITFHINTYPLTLSSSVMSSMGKEFGDLFGVNVVFVNKNPTLFDQSDWDGWLSKIDCFYLDSLGRMTQSPFIIEKQGDFAFVGLHFFARKRFERRVIQRMRDLNVEEEINAATARLMIFCEWNWLQNNEVRLTQEKQDVPMEDQENPEQT